VWTIFENGLGPVKDEVRIDIPLLLKQVKYVGIALPKLHFRDAAYPALEIRNGSDVLGTTEELFNMDAVVAKEFQIELPQAVTRAVLSVLIKTAMQYEAEQAGGQLGSILGAVYTAATTGADTRIWTSLPKNFQVARFSRPADGRLSITAPGGTSPLLQVDLPQAHFAIVYIKIPAAGAPATYEIFSSGV